MDAIIITQEDQLRDLLQYYYQQMHDFGRFITFERYPSIAWAKNEAELMQIVREGEIRGFLKYEHEMISITEAGKSFIDNRRNKVSKPSVFIWFFRIY